MGKNRHMSKYLDIVKLYLGDYTSEMTGREIARRLGINPQTALNHLDSMDYMTVKVDGRNHNFLLDLPKYKARLLIEMAELYAGLEALQIRTLNSLINELATLCESIVVYGSYAKGSFRNNSDIDIMFVGETSPDIKKVIRRLPFVVQYEIVSYSDFKKSLFGKNALALEIAKNHLLFGNVGKIVDIFYEWYLR